MAPSRDTDLWTRLSGVCVCAVVLPSCVGLEDDGGGDGSDSAGKESAAFVEDESGTAGSDDGEGGDGEGGHGDGVGDGEGGEPEFDGDCELSDCIPGLYSCAGRFIFECVQISDEECAVEKIDCGWKVCDPATGNCEWECVLNDDCP